MTTITLLFSLLILMMMMMSSVHGFHTNLHQRLIDSTTSRKTRFPHIHWNLLHHWCLSFLLSCSSYPCPNWHRIVSIATNPKTLFQIFPKSVSKWCTHTPPHQPHVLFIDLRRPLSPNGQGIGTKIFFTLLSHQTSRGFGNGIARGLCSTLSLPGGVPRGCGVEETFRLSV